jgi:hypothetical protein
MNTTACYPGYTPAQSECIDKWLVQAEQAVIALCERSYWTWTVDEITEHVELICKEGLDYHRNDNTDRIAHAYYRARAAYLGEYDRNEALMHLGDAQVMAANMIASSGREATMVIRLFAKLQGALAMRGEA